MGHSNANTLGLGLATVVLVIVGLIMLLIFG